MDSFKIPKEMINQNKTLRKIFCTIYSRELELNTSVDLMNMVEVAKKTQDKGDKLGFIRFLWWQGPYQ